MPRSPRIEFPGAMYHVLARGNRREAIVLGDDDRWMLLRTLGEMARWRDGPGSGFTPMP